MECFELSTTLLPAADFTLAELLSDNYPARSARGNKKDARAVLHAVREHGGICVQELARLAATQRAFNKPGIAELR